MPPLPSDRVAITKPFQNKPHFPIFDRRFATSPTETLIVPENYRLPTECDSFEMAKHQFRNCTNKLICACEGAKVSEMCNCPDDSIMDIRSTLSNRLPTITPSVEIAASTNEIKAFSNEGEVLISFESALFLNSASFIVDQPCTVEFGNITGCYNCQHGAQIPVTCRTETRTWITIQCDSQAFSIECGPEAKRSKILLDLKSATVQQKCVTTCNKKDIELQLSGFLSYHPFVKRRSVFETDVTPELPYLDWFTDLNLSCR
ncbi:hypothetical protein Aduo_008632 [Ancylostoma duodenale]